MIIDKMLLHHIKIFKMIKNVVLKNGVKFMLHACDNDCLFKRVDALVIKRLLPVECLKIINGHFFEDVQHSCDNFGLVHVINIELVILSWQEVIGWSIGLPNWWATFESVETNDMMEYLLTSLAYA